MLGSCTDGTCELVDWQSHVTSFSISCSHLFENEVVFDANRFSVDSRTRRSPYRVLLQLNTFRG